MQVLVMAAGGIGGYYGGLAARAGEDVIFIARGEHLNAIRERGLAVKSIDAEFELPRVRATSNPADTTLVDLVLFSVKTYDTDAAAHAIKPVIGDSTAVVSFQNGVESVEAIGAVIGPEHIVPAPTQIETFIAAPGRIEQKSSFRVVTFSESDMDRFPQLARLADIFRSANFQVNVVIDRDKALWDKFIRLAPVSGLASLARALPFDLFQNPVARDTLEASIQEAVSVGRAEGVNLSQKDIAGAVDWALGLKPGLSPSMLKDVERGNRLEIDALSGAIVRLGKKRGIPTPVHATIYTGLKPVDERNRLARERGNGR